MTVSQIPAYLRLASSEDAGFAPSAPPPFQLSAYSKRTRLLSQSQLAQRLALVGELALSAPLSFVAVEVFGLEGAPVEKCETVLNEVAGEILRLTRATDAAGRLGLDGFGIVLQGTGATAAAAVAARLSFHANRLESVTWPIEVRASAASGTGKNAAVLITAARDSLGDCG